MSHQLHTFDNVWVPMAQRLQTCTPTLQQQDMISKLMVFHNLNNLVAIRGLFTEMLAEDPALKMLMARYVLMEPVLDSRAWSDLNSNEAWVEMPYVHPLSLIALSLFMYVPGDAATVINFAVQRATMNSVKQLDIRYLCVHIFGAGIWDRDACNVLYDCGIDLFNNREIPNDLAVRIRSARRGN